MIMITAYSAGVDFRRQILTTTVDPRAVSVNIFIMAVLPWHMYSKESERPNEEIYDDFKLREPFDLHGLYESISTL